MSYGESSGNEWAPQSAASDKLLSDRTGRAVIIRELFSGPAKKICTCRYDGTWDRATVEIIYLAGDRPGPTLKSTEVTARLLRRPTQIQPRRGSALPSPHLQERDIYDNKEVFITYLHDEYDCSLADLPERLRKYPGRRTGIALDIVTGLQELRDMGLAHPHLRPEDILITLHGRAHVAGYEKTEPATPITDTAQLKSFSALLELLLSGPEPDPLHAQASALAVAAAREPTTATSQLNDIAATLRRSYSAYSRVLPEKTKCYLNVQMQDGYTGTLVRCPMDLGEWAAEQLNEEYHGISFVASTIEGKDPLGDIIYNDILHDIAMKHITARGRWDELYDYLYGETDDETGDDDR